jgi:hypothetical protein
MLTVQLQGGLGNQLFQLAFLDYASKITGKQKYINSLVSPGTVHSRDQYYDTIFHKWRLEYGTAHSFIINENSYLKYEDWYKKLENSRNICLLGYFQRCEYTDLIKEEFISKLYLNQFILKKYPDIQTKTFIHVRGGDYIGNSYHFFDLKNYYKKCIDICNGEFVIFTNDIPYAKSILPDIPIISESELDTLSLMSQCAGCICANSSFSWWGAYLNTNRPIYLPSQWFRDPLMDTSGYYFKGAQIIDINV